MNRLILLMMLCALIACSPDENNKGELLTVNVVIPDPDEFPDIAPLTDCDYVQICYCCVARPASSPVAPILSILSRRLRKQAIDVARGVG